MTKVYETIGLDNYRDLLLGEHTEDGRVVKASTRQKDFFIALKNTTYYVLGVVPAQTFLALVLAVIVNQRWLKAKGFFRTAFYFPSITSSVVISIIFMWMFYRGGLVNTTLQGLFPSYDSNAFVNWLTTRADHPHHPGAVRCQAHHGWRLGQRATLA